MTKAEEMKIRLNYINDVQELKDIILQQAKEIDDLTKYAAKYDEALINAENERLKYLEQNSFQKMRDSRLSLLTPSSMRICMKNVHVQRLRLRKEIK